MREFKNKKLVYGKSKFNPKGIKVKKRKQALAIALSKENIKKKCKGKK